MMWTWEDAADEEMAHMMEPQPISRREFWLMVAIGTMVCTGAAFVFYWFVSFAIDIFWQWYAQS